ncbi:MAG: lipoate--protein ligase [Oscillospiraceae bacterium]|nr:lipoate--protein ligase [Oscillospiraceae bacterium]
MPLWIEMNRTDPPWNLAAEEYFLSTRDETIFMLWRNSRSVIIGKNQDLEAEVDTDRAASLGIPVVRRMTGGGAVFHDLGNVNFTYMFTFDGKHEMSFEPFAKLLINVLADLGVTAELSGRNDILVKGKKISGCAHACLGNRAIYHGTLLFSADVSQMEGLLRFSEEKYRGRGIRSVSSRVTNLNELLPDMDVERFIEELRVRLSEGCTPYVINADDVAAIDKLCYEKYRNPRL